MFLDQPFKIYLLIYKGKDMDDESAETIRPRRADVWDEWIQVQDAFNRLEWWADPNETKFNSRKGSPAKIQGKGLW